MSDRTKTDSPENLDRQFRVFLAAVEHRLADGAREYSNLNLSADPADLLKELEDELLDQAGWAFLGWRRIVEFRGRLASVTRALEMPVQEVIDRVERTMEDCDPAFLDPAETTSRARVVGRHHFYDLDYFTDGYERLAAEVEALTKRLVAVEADHACDGSGPASCPVCKP